MRRYNNNGRQGWGANRPDYFPNGSSRRDNAIGRRDNVGFNRQQTDEGDRVGRPTEDANHDDSVGYKLDRLIDRLDKWEVWRDDTDRRVENLEPYLSRDAEPPLGFEDGEDLEDDGIRRRRSWDRGFRSRNHASGNRESGMDTRGRRDNRGRAGFGWDQQGARQSRNQSSGYDQSFDRPSSCWDPHQRFQIVGYDKPEVVKMHPPRFDGTDASNWISRVQYYFDHLMMPDAQRLHYAVMLFDQPAADWVFNYCANNDFVTWQDFLEDVSDRFDRQGLKPDMQERLQLHRPPSLTAAMALALELADTHADRTLQPPSSTTSRRPWQNREGRGQVGSTPAQQSSQPSPMPIQTQGGPGRAADQARPPRVRVSQAEKAERARLGLCYYCPDKWVVGHVCKQRLLCYAEEGDEGVATDDENVPNNAAHNGGSNLVVPNEESLEEIVKTDNTPLQMLVGAYDEKTDDLSVPTHKELEMREDITTLLEKENKAEALRSCLEPKEKDFSVLSEKPSKRKSKENQILVDDIGAGFDMKKQDSQEKMEEKRRLFEEELKLRAEELGKTGDAHSGSQALACIYVDLNVSNVTSMNPRLPSLDADARLIPPGNDTPCLSIMRGVDKLFVMAWNFADNIGSPLLIFDRDDEGRRTTIRWAFDPGGDTAPKLLFSTLVVVLWFPP